MTKAAAATTGAPLSNTRMAFVPPLVRQHRSTMQEHQEREDGYESSLIQESILTAVQQLSYSSNPLLPNIADISKFVPKSYSLRAMLNVDDVNDSENNNEFRSQRRPWIVGHRGAVYHELENTRESFLKSWEVGADAVELDVYLLPKDNTLICFHGSGDDATPGDLAHYCLLDVEEDEEQEEKKDTDSVKSSTISKSIMELDFPMTQQLLFNPEYDEFPCHPSRILQGKIPKLEQVLLDAKRLQKQVKIELKGPGTVEPVLDLVERLDMVHMCQFSSFNFDLLGLLRKLRPQLDETGRHVYKTGALFDVPVPDDFIEHAKRIGASEIHLRYDVCTKDRVQAVHDAGLCSMAWFRGPISMKEDCNSRIWDVDNEDEAMYQAVLDTGVQQMCVNKPDVLVGMMIKQVAAGSIGAVVANTRNQTAHA